MNLYISDMHLGHSNVIGFDRRPFADRDEMDDCLIERWNARVSEDDHVYILGDFTYRSGRPASWYLERLKGHKHLVIGNHDRNTLKDENACRHFESIEIMQLVLDEGKQIVLCHYPIAEWYNSRHGSYHIYGHIHNSKDATYEYMRTLDHAYNAAACINNYTPASFDEIVSNNAAFQAD